MTTMTAPARAEIRPVPAAPALTRLTRIELRKSVDTRASRWLLIAVAVTGLVTCALSAFLGHAKDHTFHTVAGSVQGSMSVLLPVVSILLVTSEWSQHTTLQTFVLVPRRGRIVAAKIIASGIIAVLVAAYGIGLTALGTGLTSDGSWNHAATVAVGSVVVQLISQLSGVGFGLLLMSSPAAIVLNFVIPIAWGALAGGVHALHHVQPWLDPAKVSTNLLSGEVGPQRWAQAATVVLVWVVALIAAGTVRLQRRDID